MKKKLPKSEEEQVFTFEEEENLETDLKNDEDCEPFGSTTIFIDEIDEDATPF